jgi:hypothetical protein
VFSREIRVEMGVAYAHRRYCTVSTPELPGFSEGDGVRIVEYAKTTVSFCVFL